MKMRSTGDEVLDKSSVEYQLSSWMALKKSINDAVNNVTVENIREVAEELFTENLTRGRGLFCEAIMEYGEYTNVFAALVSVVNSRFPDIGALLVKRIVIRLIITYQKNYKARLIETVKFLAHLVNQRVVSAVIASDLLTILLWNPTNDRVEVAVRFVTECGAMLQDLCPNVLDDVFTQFRDFLHEEEICDVRIRVLIKRVLRLPTSGFRGHPAMNPELDLVEDQITHQVSLFIDDDNVHPENALDVLGKHINPERALDGFVYDPDFLERERKHKIHKKLIFDSDEVLNIEDSTDEVSKDGKIKVQDCTELRKSIYLIITSSDGIVEASHNLWQIMKLNPGEEMHLCHMLLECCIQEKTYHTYYGFLGEQFCKINKIYSTNFEACFVQHYSMIHQLDTNLACNVAKFFAHLFATDALPWNVLSSVRLTEEDTTDSSRIFLKLIFQELSEQYGILMLTERLMQESFGQSIFPKDSPKNTRFAIGFFASIGLGVITDNLQKIALNASSFTYSVRERDWKKKRSSNSDDSDS